MNKTILVLEDDKSLSSAIKISLAKNNFNVLIASSVESAVEVLKSSESIDAVWLDHYLLGDKSGLDFMYELKSDEKWKNIPVFVVTNSVSDDKINSYNVLGIEKYFVKSDNSLAEIIGSIKNIIY